MKRMMEKMKVKEMVDDGARKEEIEGYFFCQSMCQLLSRELETKGHH